MRRLATLTILTVALAIGAAPAGGATWSEPQPVYAPTPADRWPADAQLSFVADGRAVALIVGTTGHRCAGEGHCHPPAEAGTAVRAGRNWSSPSWVGPLGSAELSTTSKGEALLLGGRMEFDGWDAYYEAAVDLRAGRVADDGVVFGPPQRAWRGSAAPVAHDANAVGEVVTAWTGVVKEGAPRKLYVSVRGRGGRFMREPAVLKVDRDSYVFANLSVAINDNGDALVVWQDGNWFRARFAPRGKKFGKVVNVGQTVLPAQVAVPARIYPSARAHLDDARNVTILWSRTRGSTAELWASRGRAGKPFRDRRQLDVWTDPEGRPASFAQPLVAGGSEEALFVWSSGSRHDSRVRVVRFRGTSVTLGHVPGTEDSLGHPAGVDSLPDGRTALLWQRGVGVAATEVLVSLREPGGMFGPPELVENVDRYAYAHDVAINPMTREPTVIFSIAPERYDGVPSLHAVDRIP